MAVFSGSDSSTTSRELVSRNRLSLSEASGEMPTTLSPAASRSGSAVVKSTACVVHPGVNAAG